MKKGELRKYLNCAKKELICSSSIKEAYICELKSRINDFAEQNGDLTLDMLYTEFGSPKEIANNFWNNEDLEALKEKAKKYNAVKWVAIGILIALVLSMIITHLLIVLDEDYYTKMYITYIGGLLL